MKAMPPGDGRKIRHTRAFRCPVCDGADGDPRGKGKRCTGFTMNGWANCSREEHAGSLRATAADTYSHKQDGPCPCGTQHGFDTPMQSTPVRDAWTTYDYHDETGALLYQVVRMPATKDKPKDFRQRRWDPAAKDYVWGLQGTRRVPFRLPELIRADAASIVLICEGEKDVLAAVELGFVATCNPMGAGESKWKAVEDTARQAMKGRQVVVVADADDAGRPHAQAVKESLTGHARCVCIIEMPGGHKDLSDAVAAGVDKADIVRTIREALQKDIGKEGIAVPAQWLTSAPPTRKWLLRDARVASAPGILPLGKTGQILGEGGVSKTMAIVQLALAVATGTPWLGTFSPNAGRVLLLLGEEDLEECHRRVYHAAKASGVTSIPVGSIVVRALAGVPTPLIASGEHDSFHETQHVEELRRHIKDQEVPYHLVVFDPLSRFAGKDAETDNAAATRFVQVLESFAALGPTVLVAHHTNKTSRGANGTVTSASARGSSALIDGVRWACSLAHRETEGLAPEEAERIGRSVVLSFTKSNYSVRGEDVELRRHADHGGALVPFDDADVLAVTKARGEGRGAAKRQVLDSKRESAETLVVEMARRQPGMSTNEVKHAVMAELDCSERIAEGAISLAKANGTLQFKREGNRWNVYVSSQ